MLMRSSLSPFILKKIIRRKIIGASVRLYSEYLKAVRYSATKKSLLLSVKEDPEYLPQYMTVSFTWVLLLVWTSRLPLHSSKDEIAEYRSTFYCVLWNFIVLSCKVFVRWLQFLLGNLQPPHKGSLPVKLGGQELNCVSLVQQLPQMTYLNRWKLLAKLIKLKCRTIKIKTVINNYFCKCLSLLLLERGYKIVISSCWRGRIYSHKTKGE